MTDRNEAPGPLADFGYEHVPWAEKKDRVRGVFDSVAARYDLMNDLMSAGCTVSGSVHAVADGAAAGPERARRGGRHGDIAAGMARQVGARGLVVLSDINASMLRTAATGCSTRAAAQCRCGIADAEACRSRTRRSTA